MEGGGDGGREGGFSSQIRVRGIDSVDGMLHASMLVVKTLHVAATSLSVWRENGSATCLLDGIRMQEGMHRYMSY